MSGSAYLYIDEYHVADYPRDLSFESLLMFVQQDLMIEDHEVANEEDSPRTYKFRTTVAKAKQRLDSRGINLYLCRQLFERFRADEVYQYHYRPGHSIGGNYIKNPFDFEYYLKTLERVFSEKGGVGIPPSFKQHDWKGDQEAKWISEWDVFDYESSTYYSDILSCVYVRSLLEVSPSSSLRVVDSQ